MNVKKILIIIGVIIVIAAACYVGGYSVGRTKVNAVGIAEGEKLIRKQETRIEALESELDESITENQRIIAKLRDSKSEIEILKDKYITIETGLSKDIEGLSGVIGRLDYYIGKAEN